MSAEIEIRGGHPQEREALVAIQHAAAVDAFAHIYPPEHYPFPDEAVAAEWKRALADPDVEIYVAEHDGAAVGTVAVAGDELRRLYVLPEHQGRGIGSRLHDLALVRMRDRGVTRARLWTLEANNVGRRFYERRGWIPTGDVRNASFPPQPLDIEYGRRSERWPTPTRLTSMSHHWRSDRWRTAAPLAVSLAGPSSFWVGVYRNGAWFVDHTTDAGDNWQTRLVAHATSVATYCPLLPDLQAVNDHTAWFTFMEGRKAVLFTPPTAGDTGENCSHDAKPVTTIRLTHARGEGE